MFKLICINTHIPVEIDNLLKYFTKIRDDFSTETFDVSDARTTGLLR